MKKTYIRCVINGKTVTGLLENGEVYSLTGDLFSEPGKGERIGALSQVERWLAPTDPTKVVAVGLNYRDHAEEVKLPIPEEPLIFLKPSTSVVAHGDTVIYPDMSSRVDYEAELAVVMGKRCSDVSPEKALDYVAGYTCANDVTARDLQGRDGQWTRAKSFDTFCPLGPVLVTGIDASDLEVKMLHNSTVVQHSRTSQFIFPVNILVSHISRVMTLLPGDVIITGTPSGIAPVQRGDLMEVEIEHIGRLANTVA